MNSKKINFLMGNIKKIGILVCFAKDMISDAHVLICEILPGEESITLV